VKVSHVIVVGIVILAANISTIYDLRYSILGNCRYLLPIVWRFLLT